MRLRPDSILSVEFLNTTDSLFEDSIGQTSEFRKERLERLIRCYGPPLTSYLVRSCRLSRDSAEDCLQGFLIEKLIEPTPGNDIAALFLKRKNENPEVRFRDYLRRSLRNHLCDLVRKKAIHTVTLDAMEYRGTEFGSDNSDDLEYDVNWANSLLNQACVAVRAECHMKEQFQVWDVFYQRLLRPVETGVPAATYEELCSTGRFDSPKQAANFYMTAIRKFNRVLRQLVSEYLPSNGRSEENAIETELRDLQKALASSGELHLGDNVDFSLSESIHTLRQRLLCVPDDVASLWSDNDLKYLWQTLLKGSLKSLWTEVSSNTPETYHSDAGAWDETLTSLFTREEPNLSVLRTVKDVAKSHASATTRALGICTNTENVFPPSITMLLYAMSIAVARLRLNERITRDRDEQFVPRACRLLEFTWIDDQTRQTLRDWLGLLQK